VDVGAIPDWTRLFPPRAGLIRSPQSENPDELHGLYNRDANTKWRHTSTVEEVFRMCTQNTKKTQKTNLSHVCAFAVADLRQFKKKHTDKKSKKKRAAPEVRLERANVKMQESTQITKGPTRSRSASLARSRQHTSTSVRPARSRKIPGFKHNHSEKKQPPSVSRRETHCASLPARAPHPVVQRTFVGPPARARCTVRSADRPAGDVRPA